MSPKSTTPNIPLVFISGMGRSGSTLLGRALGQISGWWSLGEVVHLWTRGVRDNERCACGDLFHDCPVWTAVGEEAFGGWGTLDLERIIDLQQSVDRDRFVIRNLSGRRDLGHSQRLVDYRRLLLRLYSGAQTATASRVLVDSSKHVSTAVVLDKVAGLDLKIVHLIRDSRGVAYSWTKRVERPETDGADTMTQWSPLHTAARYVGYNYFLQGLSHARPWVQRVRYEDFVTDPGAVLSNIVDFVGRGTEDLHFVTNSTLQLDPSHEIGGNPSRFTSGPIDVRADERWRTEMPDRQRRLVTALTLPLLAQHGYAKTGSIRRPDRR